MLSASDVARYFLGIQDKAAGDLISNLKLQKLLYYAQGFHLALHDEPLFAENIKAWKHGPVVPQVWHDYRHLGSRPLPRKPINMADYKPRVRELLDEVYGVYGQFSAWRLRDLTHDEPPWAEAYNGSGVISEDTMRRFFRTRLTTS